MILSKNGWTVGIVREGLDFLLCFLDLLMDEVMEGKVVRNRKMGLARNCCALADVCSLGRASKVRYWTCYDSLTPQHIVGLLTTNVSCSFSAAVVKSHRLQVGVYFPKRTNMEVDVYAMVCYLS